MRIQLDHSQNTQFPTQPTTSFSSKDSSLYHSRIVSAKNSKPVEYFWKAWGFCKTAVLTAYDYIVWIIRCCPSIPSKIEVIEQMIDNPKEKAEEFLKNPIENICTFFQAALINPEGVDDLRKEDGYGKLLREIAGKLPKNIFDGEKKGPLAALKALANPFTSKDSSALFGSLLNLLTDNIAVLGDAMLKACEQVTNALGSGNSENEKSNALKGLFGTYFPAVAEEAKLNPGAFKQFITECYKLKQIDESIIPLMQKHFPDKARPKADDLKNLKFCLKNNGLALSQLGEPKLASSKLDADRSVDLLMAFYQGILQAATPEMIDKAIDLIKTDYPLMAGLAKAFKEEIANDKASLELASQNLPKALNLLKVLQEDYKNPPAKKEAKK